MARETEQLSDIVTTDADNVEMDVEKDDARKDPRQAIYDNYANKTTEQEDGATDEEGDPEPVIEEKAKAVEEEQEVKDETEENEFVTVKIYGDERQVSRADVEAAGGKDLYQIKAAQEDRLKEVNEERHRLKEERKAFDAERDKWAREHQAKEEVPDQEHNEVEPGKKDALVELHQKYRDAWLEGEDEKATELQLEIDRAVRETRPEVDISTAVDSRLAEYEHTRDIQRGNEWYKTTYPDIYADEMLNGMANNRFKQLREEQPEAPASRLIHDAVETVHEWLEQKTGKTNDVQDRVDKKRRTVQPKKASVRQEKKPEPKPLTRSEVVAEIRKTRGLEA